VALTVLVDAVSDLPADGDFRDAVLGNPPAVIAWGLASPQARREWEQVWISQGHGAVERLAVGGRPSSRLDPRGLVWRWRIIPPARLSRHVDALEAWRVSPPSRPGLLSAWLGHLGAAPAQAALIRGWLSSSPARRMHDLYRVEEWPAG
jgi:hypothetical protein